MQFGLDLEASGSSTSVWENFAPMAGSTSVCTAWRAVCRNEENAIVSHAVTLAIYGKCDVHVVQLTSQGLLSGMAWTAYPESIDSSHIPDPPMTARRSPLKRLSS